MGLCAHSTRSMATSWALFQGVSIEEICVAASWAMTHTFTRFYKLDVITPTLSHTVLNVPSLPNVPFIADSGSVTSLQDNVVWQFGSLDIP